MAAITRNKFGWRKVLSFASDILQKIPRRGDGLFTTIIKVLAIVDSYNVQMSKGKSTALFDFFGSLDLEEVTNAQFVSLFYSTGLRNNFKVRKFEMGDYMEIVKAEHAGIGTLYFVEWHWGSRPEPSADFWHTKGFNFEKTLVVLWDRFHGRIHLGLTQDNKNGELKSTYSEIPEPTDPLLGKAASILEAFKEQHLLYVKDKVPRTYLFCGKQGIGKTCFCLRLSKLTGGRTLRIDACGITAVGVKDLDFIINGLNPNFLIVDDIDRAPDLEKSLPTLFAILSDFKCKHPNVTVALTINDITKLDPALLRPGRIDEIIELEPPDEEDRGAILQGYLNEFKVTNEVDLKKISGATEGLTAAYLREIALQLRYRPQDSVLKVVTRMNELASAKEEKKEETKKCATPV